MRDKDKQSYNAFIQCSNAPARGASAHHGIKGLLAASLFLMSRSVLSIADTR